MKKSAGSLPRKNRISGTGKQSFGRETLFSTPSCWPDRRIYWEKLKNPVIINLKLAAKNYKLFVEPTRKGHTHACTVADLARMLNLLPEKYIKNIDMFVFRQPKRTEIIFAPCWGRIGYRTNIAGYSGTAIFLEAQQIDKPLKWGKSLAPCAKDELERLREDGHIIVPGKRHYLIKQTLNSVRSTQLFRTLLHEIGHNNDPNSRGQITPGKEEFAHGFAGQMRKKLLADGSIPFPRIFNAGKIQSSGLQVEWFVG